MSGFLITKIERAIERENIPVDLVRKALADKDINTRGIGYVVLTEPHLRAMIKGYKPKTGDPVACLAYLLECIRADLEWDEDYAHFREEALGELATPLDPYWAGKGVALDPAVYWREVTACIKANLTEFDEAVVTFLSAFETDMVFESAMDSWRRDATLSAYVDALGSKT